MTIREEIEAKAKYFEEHIKGSEILENYVRITSDDKRDRILFNLDFKYDFVEKVEEKVVDFIDPDGKRGKLLDRTYAYYYLDTEDLRDCLEFYKVYLEEEEYEEEKYAEEKYEEDEEDKWWMFFPEGFDRDIILRDEEKVIDHDTRRVLTAWFYDSLYCIPYDCEDDRWEVTYKEYQKVLEQAVRDNYPDSINYPFNANTLELIELYETVIDEMEQKINYSDCYDALREELMDMYSSEEYLEHVASYNDYIDDSIEQTEAMDSYIDNMSKFN